MQNSLIVFITCCNLLLFYTGFVTSSNCIKIAECQCVLEDGRTGIDLSGINTTIASNFSNQGYSVAFNPCRPVNLTNTSTETYKGQTIPVVNTCNDTTLICVTTVVALRISIGTYDTLNYEVADPSNVYISSNSSGWLTTIKLVCSNATNSSTLSVRSYDPMSTPKILKAELFSEKACVVDIPTNSSESSGWKTFFIIIFVILFVYFVGGIMFKTYFFDAHGMEMLPNHLFWINVIESIADFWKYIASGCKRGSAYNEI